MARVELTIGIDPDVADHERLDQLRVAGTLRPEGGAEVGFVGWVGLLALLQQLVTDDAVAAETS